MMFLYEELASGNRKVGGQKLFYEDIVNRQSLNGNEYYVRSWNDLLED